MRKKHNLCCTVSERPRPLSLGLEQGGTGGPRWPAHVRVCENVNVGEVKYYEKLVGKYPKSKTVCFASLPSPLSVDFA